VKVAEASDGGVPCVNVEARLQQAGDLSTSSVNCFPSAALQHRGTDANKCNFKRPDTSIGMRQIELLPARMVLPRRFFFSAPSKLINSRTL
jgi:hypothetical protein